MKSICKKVEEKILFPDFKGRLLYMHKTPMGEVSLPPGFTDYENTIRQMLKKALDKNNVCYVTIDERRLQKGVSHRRGGPHVDFNWYENIKGTGQWGRWGKQELPILSGRHGQGDMGGGGHGNRHDVLGGMLLASSYSSCQVWKGDYSGTIGEGGCCKEIDLSKLKTSLIPSNEAYYVGALGIHESLAVKDVGVERSLIRINFHPEYNWRDSLRLAA